MCKRLFIMGLIAMVLGILGCNAQDSKFRSVEVEEFAKVIADTSVVRLDVRRVEEFSQGHIDGAINIDVLQEDFEKKALASLPIEKTVALYCRSGNRSKKASQILSGKGYKVVELATGYLGWEGAGKPVIK